MNFYSFAVHNNVFIISREGFVVANSSEEAEEKICARFKIEKGKNLSVIIQECDVFEFPRNWLY
jgi:hypothetical protein